MIVHELIKLNKRVLEVMSSASVEVNDVKHVPMFEEYQRLDSEGYKRTYIMTYLSDEYNISERQVYRIVKRLTKEVKI